MIVVLVVLSHERKHVGFRMASQCISHVFRKLLSQYIVNRSLGTVEWDTLRLRKHVSDPKPQVVPRLSEVSPLLAPVQHEFRAPIWLQTTETEDIRIKISFSDLLLRQ